MAHSTCCTSQCRAYTRALDVWLSSAVYAARAQRKYLADKNNDHAAATVAVRRSQYRTLFGLMLELGMDVDSSDIRLLSSKISTGAVESVERIRARLLAENASEGAGD